MTTEKKEGDGSESLKESKEAEHLKSDKGGKGKSRHDKNSSAKKDVNEGKTKSEKQKTEAKPQDVSKSKKAKELVYMVSLKDAYAGPRANRARRATNMIREFLERNLKTENIAFDDKLNRILWRRGIENPPRKVRVKAIKTDEGVTATIAS